MPKLTFEILQKEATKFSKAESLHAEKTLYGVTDGKAIRNLSGTYINLKPIYEKIYF